MLSRDSLRFIYHSVIPCAQQVVCSVESSTELKKDGPRKQRASKEGLRRGTVAVQRPAVSWAAAESVAIQRTHQAPASKNRSLLRQSVLQYM
jgi:hypothetical protein